MNTNHAAALAKLYHAQELLLLGQIEAAEDKIKEAVACLLKTEDTGDTLQNLKNKYNGAKSTKRANK